MFNNIESLLIKPKINNTNQKIPKLQLTKWNEINLSYLI